MGLTLEGLPMILVTSPAGISGTSSASGPAGAALDPAVAGSDRDGEASAAWNRNPTRSAARNRLVEFMTNMNNTAAGAVTSFSAKGPRWGHRGVADNGRAAPARSHIVQAATDGYRMSRSPKK